MLKSLRDALRFSLPYSIAVGTLVHWSPQVWANEPVEWCRTNQDWVAMVGNPIASAGESCPTKGDCDIPSVRDLWIADSSTPILYVRLKIHVFCTLNAEDECTATPATVAAAIARLNSDFWNSRIQFATSVAYHPTGSYREFLIPEEAAMKEAHADQPERQINVYVVDFDETNVQVYDGKGTYAWDPRALTNQGGIIINHGAFGANFSTLTHECGHNLGLWHTHYGDEVGACSACYEPRNGSDRDTTGDFAADTPATPQNYQCADVDGTDGCDANAPAWAPTLYNNYMGYAPVGCRDHFTEDQIARMHCWVRDRLAGWISCTTVADCDWGCAVPSCTEGLCQYTITQSETANSTCRDGADNDCDGFADCEDVADCHSDPGCNCFDNEGISPLVCVDWAAALPPQPNQDFTIDTLADPENPNAILNPNVRFVTGNDSWRVWSQVSRTDHAPANLGHIGINPLLPTANFGVTLAHGSLPGANNVVSMPLVKTSWTGQSSLGPSRISGNLTGNLVLQESAGQGGVASMVIEGNADGNVVIPKVHNLRVEGAVSSTASLALGIAPGGSIQFNARRTRDDDFAGDLSLPNGLPQFSYGTVFGDFTGTASIDFQGQELAGVWIFRLGTAAQSVLIVGPLTGDLELYYRHSGTATFTRIGPGGGIIMQNAAFDGRILVVEDMEGVLSVSSSTFDVGAEVSIGGSLASGATINIYPPSGSTPSGNILIGQNCEGTINIAGSMNGDILIDGGVSGEILVGGAIDGNVVIGGLFSGNICGSNISVSAPLPSNIDIAAFGPSATICGVSICESILLDLAGSTPGGRDLSFSTTSLATTLLGSAVGAIEIVMLDLQNPNPANPPCCAPPDFGSYESQICNAAGELGGCNRYLGPPVTILENTNDPNAGSYKASRLQCSPHFTDWTTVGTVHITGAEMIPSSTYELRFVPQDPNLPSCSRIFQTARWGDIDAPFNPPSATPQPDALDVVALVNKFRGVASAPGKSRAVNQPNVPNVLSDLNALDIVAVVDAIVGKAYPFSGPCPCPSAVTCNATSCTSASQCPGGLCVKTCGSASDGTICQRDSDCISTSTCTVGAVGATCNSHPDCSIQGVCVGIYCTLGNVGSHCGTNDDCDVYGVCTLNPVTCGTPVTGGSTGFCRDQCERCRN